MSKPRENGSTGNAVGGTAFCRFVPGAESHVCHGAAPARASGPSAAELDVKENESGSPSPPAHPVTEFSVLGAHDRGTVAPRGKEAGVFSFVNMSGDGGQSRSGNGFIPSWGGGLGSYRHVDGDLPVALQSRARALAPLPSIADTQGVVAFGPPVALAPSLTDGSHATSSAGRGGGRGVYCGVDGDLPVAWCLPVAGGHAAYNTCFLQPPAGHGGGFDFFQEVDAHGGGFDFIQENQMNVADVSGTGSTPDFDACGNVGGGF